VLDKCFSSETHNWHFFQVFYFLFFFAYINCTERFCCDISIYEYNVLWSYSPPYPLLSSSPCESAVAVSGQWVPGGERAAVQEQNLAHNRMPYCLPWAKPVWAWWPYSTTWAWWPTSPWPWTPVQELQEKDFHTNEEDLDWFWPIILAAHCQK
jgi:hypothetical protein